jgi:hypothetical protein
MRSLDQSLFGLDIVFDVYHFTVERNDCRKYKEKKRDSNNYFQKGK